MDLTPACRTRVLLGVFLGEQVLPVAAASNDSGPGLLTRASAHLALAPCPPPLPLPSHHALRLSPRGRPMSRRGGGQRRVPAALQRSPEAEAEAEAEVTRQSPLRILCPLPPTSSHLLLIPNSSFSSPPHLLIRSHLLSFPPSPYQRCSSRCPA